MTQLFGIVNVTPDSFSDGSDDLSVKTLLKRAEQLFADGADYIDVGAEATNPFVAPLTWQDEWARLQAFLPALLAAFPGKVSLDTYHPETAAQALHIGPVIINDVTTFRDPEMIKLAAHHKATCIVSHLPFSAASIEEAHKHATVDDITAVKSELLQRRDEMIAAGAHAETIILDPGIGFGKTMELNQKLLEFAKEVPGIPILIGHSRKRFLGENRFETEPNLAAARKAIAAGAKYLRVHDVKAHRELIETL